MKTQNANRKSSLSLLLVALLAAATVAGCALAPSARPFAEAGQPHAVLDFTPPPPGGDLTPARLLAVDGVIGPATAARHSYWVSPGERELKIFGEETARDKVGIPARRGDPGTVVMRLDAGRRYYIAIRWFSDARNDWEPVVWRIEDLPAAPPPAPTAPRG